MPTTGTTIGLEYMWAVLHVAVGVLAVINGAQFLFTLFTFYTVLNYITIALAAVLFCYHWTPPDFTAKWFALGFVWSLILLAVIVNEALNAGGYFYDGYSGTEMGLGALIIIYGIWMGYLGVRDTIRAYHLQQQKRAVFQEAIETQRQRNVYAAAGRKAKTLESEPVEDPHI